ncbi:MAG: endo-1,4-beta-xylanase [Oscillospiraceae bacterium]|jgi:GH35 family endo-1,4-beta-xylanase|nr:endo-1,4-beta-xylanase [Oscillospiraceae bacterium]
MKKRKLTLILSLILSAMLIISGCQADEPGIDLAPDVPESQDKPDSPSDEQLGNNDEDDVAGENVIFSFTFDNEAEYGEFFSSALHSEIEWASGFGHDDDYALRVTLGGTNYNSANNAVILTLPEPLPVDALYNVTAWFYVPEDENPDKELRLGGPGFVLNHDYAADLGVSKFPADNDSTYIYTGVWTEINVDLPLMYDPIEMIDFRFYTNDAPTHPDVWYLDNIVITKIGSMEEVQEREWDLTLPSLKDAFSDYFMIGNVMEPNQIGNADTVAMFTHHYNAVTAENSMKPSYLAPRKGEYEFAGADALVEWAEQNNIALHGHTLVWHSQSPAWLTVAEDGGPLTRAEARANMEDFINTVAGRYAGRIYSWDVVNEAVLTSVSSAPSDWRNALRKTESETEGKPSWYAAYANGADESKGECGSDYLYDAFVFARLAAPDAILYYNDFNETETGKREAIAMMTEELNERWKTDPLNTEPNRLLVEGLGMQAHYWTSNLTAASVEMTIRRFIETGAIISVSELDIPLGRWNAYDEPTDEGFERQAELYKEVFEIYMNFAEHIERVTFWGKADPQSWRGQGYPLLFDGFFRSKPAFDSIISLVS